MVTEKYEKESFTLFVGFKGSPGFVSHRKTPHIPIAWELNWGPPGTNGAYIPFNVWHKEAPCGLGSFMELEELEALEGAIAFAKKKLQDGCGVHIDMSFD